MAVTDLTGTKWKFKSSVTKPAFDGWVAVSDSYIEDSQNRFYSNNNKRYIMLHNASGYFGAFTSSVGSYYERPGIFNWSNSWRKATTEASSSETNAVGDVILYIGQCDNAQTYYQNFVQWVQLNATQIIEPSTQSTADKLQDLIDIKQDIKEAIENKGVDLTGVDFGGYAGKIDEIPLQKEEQTKTVSSPNFSSGNVVVTPDADKVLTQVTVVKDNDLVPENIVKDVNIFGVVGVVNVPSVTQLSTPTLTLTNGILSWNTVENATAYKIFKDNSLLTFETSTSYDVSKSAGTFKVKAIASGYIDSDFSNEETVLNKPTDLTGTAWLFTLKSPKEFITPYISSDMLFNVNGYAEFIDQSSTQITTPVLSPTKLSPNSSDGTNLCIGNNAFSSNTIWLYGDGSSFNYWNSSATRYKAASTMTIHFTGGSDSTNQTLIDFLWDCNHCVRVA